MFVPLDIITGSTLRYIYIYIWTTSSHYVLLLLIRQELYRRCECLEEHLDQRFPLAECGGYPVKVWIGSSCYRLFNQSGKFSIKGGRISSTVFKPVESIAMLSYCLPTHR